MPKQKRKKPRATDKRPRWLGAWFSSWFLFRCCLVAVILCLLFRSGVIDAVWERTQISEYDVNNSSQQIYRVNQTKTHGTVTPAHTRDNENETGPSVVFRQQRNDQTYQREPMNILLLTYLRGGSTFTGSLLQQIPGVFYSHEPLRYQLRHPYDAEDYFSTNGICSFASGECRKPTKSFPDTPKILSLFKAFYNCKLDRLPRRFMWSKNNITDKRLKSCIYPPSSSCPQVKYGCTKSSARVIKSVRITVSMVEPLFDNIPSLKVIYLMRDPRAMFNSRLNVRMLDWRNVTSLRRNMKAECGRIYWDMREYLRLKELYPYKIKSFLFEKLAENPSGESKKIFEFLGLKPHAQFSTWLHNVTSAGYYDSPFGHTRPVSKNLSFKWRRELKWKFVELCDAVCDRAYSYMGLKKASSESTMRNVNIPLRGEGIVFSKFDM